jgi:energy-coupling factor transport system ATP-binding protein
MNVTVDGVSFTYPSGVRALDRVSLSIESGQAVAIIGENGAGKTTLVRHINGLLRPSEGRVVVGGEDTADQSIAALARHVGYVFQNPDDQLFERTVRAEVAFGPRNLGQSPADVQANVEAALAAVGLSGQADTHPYDLHVSHRKLIALAAALAMRTPILILDEPTTGQDAPGIERLADIVEGLKADGRTLIAITHDIDFCAEHFERVIVMAGGRIVTDGPAEQVFSQTDALNRAEVAPPQLARLADALDLPALPLNVEDFLAALESR